MSYHYWTQQIIAKTEVMDKETNEAQITPEDLSATSREYDGNYINFIVHS